MLNVIVPFLVGAGIASFMLDRLVIQPDYLAYASKPNKKKSSSGSKKKSGGGGNKKSSKSKGSGGGKKSSGNKGKKSDGKGKKGSSSGHDKDDGDNKRDSVEDRKRELQNQAEQNRGKRNVERKKRQLLGQAMRNRNSSNVERRKRQLQGQASRNRSQRNIQRRENQKPRSTGGAWKPLTTSQRMRYAAGERGTKPRPFSVGFGLGGVDPTTTTGEAIQGGMPAIGEIGSSLSGTNLFAPRNKTAEREATEQAVILEMQKRGLDPETGEPLHNQTMGGGRTGWIGAPPPEELAYQ